MTPKTKAFIAVLCANIFFGVNFVVVKLVAPIAISSFALNLLRVLTASALFWLLFFFKTF